MERKDFLHGENILHKYKKWKRWQKVVTILACVVVFCTTYALILPAITLTKTTYCNEEQHIEHSKKDDCYEEKKVLVCKKEEKGHTHTDECYSQVTELVCTLEESEGHIHDVSCYDGDGNLICGMMESAGHTHSADCYETKSVLTCGKEEEEVHTHTDACYETKDVLVCKKKVHEHTQECYSNPKADVETAAVWEKTFDSVKLTGNWDEDLIAIAKTQLGYTESSANYIVDEKGNKKGYTRYGAWYGNAYGDWCAMYASFCLNYAHIDDKLMPREAGCQNWIKKLQEKKIYEKGGCEPKAGDFVFFDWEGDGTSDHVGIVAEVTKNKDGQVTDIKTIEGNCADKVQYQNYSVSSKSIMGYGVLPENPAMKKDVAAEDVKEETADEAVLPEKIVEELIQSEEETAVEDMVEDEEDLYADAEDSEDDLGMDDMEELLKAGTVTTEMAETSSARRLFAAPGIAPLAVTDPIDVDPYVVEQNEDGNKTQLRYMPAGSTEWIPVTADTKIPGNAGLRLDVVYDDVPIDTLIEAGGKISYTLPEYMKDPQTAGNIMADGKVVGSITVNGKDVLISFNDDFLQEKKNRNDTLLDGTFYVQSQIDTEIVEQEKPGELVIGNVTIDLNFEDDIVAKNTNVDVIKYCQKTHYNAETDKYYVEYVITVTAGEDGASDVKVVDYFTTNAKFANGYVWITGEKQEVPPNGAGNTNNNLCVELKDNKYPDAPSGSVYIGNVVKDDQGNLVSVTPAGESYSKPGTLVYEIGEMQSNESRRLHYLVELDDSYIGIKNAGLITNNADVYNDEYIRDQALFNYVNKSNVSTNKVASTPVLQDDGSYLITYQVTVSADAENLWPVTNVKVKDYITNEAYVPYISYVADSFVLKNSNGEEITVSNPHEGKENPVFARPDGRVEYDYYVGDLNPGESKTLTYQMRIDAGAIVALDHQQYSSFAIRNRVNTYEDDTKVYNPQVFSNSNSLISIYDKEWARKLVGDHVTEDTPVTMNGPAYQYQNNQIISVNNPGSFTVPAGSYQYKVIVNEAGGWDVSSAAMKDQLGDTHMQFVGYCKVEAFRVNNGSDFKDDQSADAYFESQTPDKTVWVNIDQLSTFGFTPKEIGLEGDYAYRFTYYAEPVNTDDRTYIVGNTFSMEGQVGIGGKEYDITGIEAEGNVIIAAEGHYSYSKYGWYYDPDDADPEFGNGKLYWLLKVDGNTIPAGTMFGDFSAGMLGMEDTTKDSYGFTFHEHSFVGVFKGALDASAILNLKDYKAVVRQGLLTPYKEDVVDFGVYGVVISEIEFKEAVSLEDGESLYLILATEPSALPEKYNDVYCYENILESIDDMESPDNWARAEIDIPGNEGVAKLPERIITVELDANGDYIGKKVRDVKGSGGETVSSGFKPNYLNLLYPDEVKTGTYLEWDVVVNSDGHLDGKNLTMEDILPDGLEVSYVKAFTPHGIAPSGATLDQATGFSGEWEEHYLNYVGYFYTQDNKVRWTTNNLHGEAHYQIFCRVTDENFNLSGDETTFNNSVRIYNEDDEELDRDSSGITVSKESLSKAALTDGLKKSDDNKTIISDDGKIPFAIDVNALGEDLIKDVDTITVVDTLSDNLEFQPSSVSVFRKYPNSTDNVLLSPNQYSVSVEGQTVKFTIPDDMHLIITYDVRLLTTPDNIIDIKNQAHWEGYTVPEKGSVSIEKVCYEAGGTASTSQTPSLKILKMDQYNISKKLQGAKFKVTEMELSGDGFVEKSGGQVWTDCTTDENGTVIIGREAGKLMNWNTVYKIEETQAPNGYIMDPAPSYFAVARKNSGQYPEILSQYTAAGATVFYNGAEYTYNAFNHKGDVEVTKNFQDASGSNQKLLDGKYKFGLYKVDNGMESLIETKTLIIANGSTENKVVFNNLDFNTDYCIYELDDEGNPIQDNSVGTVDKKLFDVTYESQDVNVTVNSPVAETSITNSVHYTELPHTGGMGTAKIYMLGILMMAVAIVLALRKSYS